MTRWDEKPTDITFFSTPETGEKIVKMDERGSAAYLNALELMGAKAHRTMDLASGMYTITIDKL